jgi:hypothetical protein
MAGHQLARWDVMLKGTFERRQKTLKWRTSLVARHTDLSARSPRLYLMLYKQ